MKLVWRIASLLVGFVLIIVGHGIQSAVAIGDMSAKAKPLGGSMVLVGIGLIVLVWVILPWRKLNGGKRKT